VYIVLIQPSSARFNKSYYLRIKPVKTGVGEGVLAAEMAVQITAGVNSR